MTIHRTSEPGHWIVAYPWREDGRARAIAEAAFALSDRTDLDPAATRPTTRRTVDSPGRSRALARMLRTIAAADTEPPEWVRDTDRRLPVISISGTNGKTTTTRMIAHILRLAGHHVGSTTSDGVFVDEGLVEAGDLTGPYGARSILDRRDVDVAVLETARGGLMLRGLGYESNDAAVLTNVSSDTHGPSRASTRSPSWRRSSRSSRASPGPMAWWSSTRTTTWSRASHAGSGHGSG